MTENLPAGVHRLSAESQAALARAKNRGAQLMNGPMDVPGGRIAQLTDPQGAVFALHQKAA